MSSALARTIMITGATDGIGQHTARKLAADGNILFVHGRKPNLGADLVEDLKKRGAQEVHYFNADLSDLDQVDALAKRVSETTDSIDVLINNAGVFDPTPAHSVQGYDMTWAVNVMAPFLLTRKLLPLIAKSEDDCPRIITTSSISQSSSMPKLEELFEKTEIAKNAHRAYSDSKLGDLMFTVQLAKILESHNEGDNEKYHKIKCLTMDPGTVNTKMLLAGWGPCGIAVRDANNTYKLATEYGAEQESGSYHFGWGGSKDAKSAEKLKGLWKALEANTGCTYDDI
ncbi:MAG: hypothetical protein SGBAC_010194 [Bacillariaceae sp.]